MITLSFDICQRWEATVSRESRSPTALAAMRLAPLLVYMCVGTRLAANGRVFVEHRTSKGG
jgi:hypothetical protein